MSAHGRCEALASAARSAQGRPVATVVLLHSSAASARQWDALAQTLAAHFEVHASELHGHGARAPWSGAAPLTLADEAAAIDALIERRGAVHLVGHSYGGAVALDAARRQPQAVRSVAVFEPVLFGCLLGDRASRAEAESVRWLAAAIHDHVGHGRDEAAAEQFISFWSGAQSWARLPAPRRAAVAARMRSVALHFDAAFAAPDPRPVLARHAVPRLVLTGAATVPATARIGQVLRDAWPDAEHATLAGLGHMGPLTDAAAVNARITEFLLRQVDPARRDIAASSLLQPETV